MHLETHLPLLLDLFLKSTVLLVLAALLTVAFRRASAANRHAIAVAALVTLLALPFTKLAQPRWSYALKHDAPAAPLTIKLPPITTAASSETGAGFAWAAPENAPAKAAGIRVNWSAVFVGVWFAGFALALLHRAGVGWQLRRLAAESRAMKEGRVVAMARKLAAVCGVRAEIRESAMCRVPLAFGVWRPTVLLPSEAMGWSDGRLSAALQHEFGHIRRRDCLTRWFADLACAFYWMNPLVWLGARSLRLAQEQACDDLVLNSGARADEYAGHLVEVVRSLQKDRFTARHALAMAQPSTLETRVLAIVDAARDRSPRSVRGAVAGFAFVAAALALCTAAQLRGADDKKAAVAAEISPTKQILIEAKFIEISGDAALLPDFMKDMARGVPGAVHAVVAPEKMQAAMRMLNQKKGVDILSAPRVTTRSKQKAVVEVVREFKYPTEWDKDAKTGKLAPTAFENKNVGVTFDVTPQVDEGGTITLHMIPQVVEFEGFMDYGAKPDKTGAKLDPGMPLEKRLFAVPTWNANGPDHPWQPIFSTRKLDTEMTIWPGQTAVLGGMDRENVQTVEDKNPKTGRVRKTEQHIKRRLFVLVTASIVEPAEVPQGKPAKDGQSPADADQKSGATASPLKIESNSATFDKKTGKSEFSGDVKIETAQAVIRADAAQMTPREKFIKLGDGVKGLQNAPARAPLTVEVGSVSSGKRGDLTTPMGGITGTGGAGASVAAADIPPQAEVRQLAEDALLLWSEGIQNGGDFSKFYEAAAGQWKNRGKSEPGGDPFNSANRLTVAALRSAFRDAIAARVDLSPIRKKKLLLSEPARVNAGGVLVLRGTCEATVFQQAGAPLREETMTFTLDFVREEGLWKNFGITIHTSGR